MPTVKQSSLALLGAVFCLSITSCISSNWHTSQMETSEDRETLRWSEFNGEIPLELRNWNIVADVSREWFSCEYGFILRYTTLSIDENNKVWIYGPDQWLGPNGERVPDAPNCAEEVRPRIVVYDQSSGQTERVQVALEDGSFLSSARGWNHIGSGKVLLTSVFIYRGPWDGSDGGAGNKFIDFAILKDGKIRDLFGGNTSNFAVPDYAISDNMLYAISSTDSNEIKILNLVTEKWMESVRLPNCDSIQSIEISNDNIFAICSTPNYQLSVRIYSRSIKEIKSWLLDGDRFDFPLAVDLEGRVWIGDKFVLKMNDEEWMLDGIAPPQDVFIQGQTQAYRRRIFGMFPYNNRMVFNLEGAIYLAAYDQKMWISIIHRAPPLPLAVGNDGSIYAFTGRYIISTKP